MAAVLTFTEQTLTNPQMLICDWLSHTDGSGSDTTDYTYAGKLIAALFVPDSGGTAPDDQYDVTVTDGTNDLLFGQGVNLSGTNSVAILSNMGVAVGNKLTVSITGAGDGNGGLIYLYFERSA